MAVKIRLRRVGRKKQPSYRVIVTHSENPRNGMYLDTVGYYNPKRTPAELNIDLAKIDEWIERGATMSETTESLVKKARRGGDMSLLVSGMPGGARVVAESETAVAAPAADEAAADEAAADETAVTE